MAPAEGARVFLCYDLPPPEPELLHKRYILAACACGQSFHIILTPNLATYTEQVSVENSDITSLRIGMGGQLPAGVIDASTFHSRSFRILI